MLAAIGAGAELAGRIVTLECKRRGAAGMPAARGRVYNRSATAATGGPSEIQQ
jgi:hypothetical protein